MAYWKIKILTEPKRVNSHWSYNGFIYDLGPNVEYGDSPIRDKKSRLEFISALVKHGIDFEVEYKD